MQKPCPVILQRAAILSSGASNHSKSCEFRMKSGKIVIWILAASAVVATALALWLRLHHWRPRTIAIQGAVVRLDSDSWKELPIAGAQVTASDGSSQITSYSDASGYFRLLLNAGVWPKRTVALRFQDSGYQPHQLVLQLGLRSASRKLLVVELKPIPQSPPPGPSHPATVVNNIRIRYTLNVESDTNVGSAVRTFQVVNQGDVPCDHQSPCSPHGEWKAAMNSVTVDAGPGNVFRNARTSCIAGPCPFTRINSSGFVNGGRVITASALDWSDTATFLLEAEVFRDTIDSSVRESYPVVFGRTLTFTLPPTQEGVSIEAELNGTPMVFPLGPDLYLSWATCTARSNADKSTVYQCELKPGYNF
jgi:hypothetical protein